MKINIKMLITISTIAFMSVSCAPKVEVSAIKLAKGLVESTVTTTSSGTVEAREQAELAFGTPGRIAKIHVQLGAKVKKGALIAELENADLKAVYNEAIKEYNRARELYKNGLVSIANLDATNRALEVARINLDKTMIKAPFEGMITALNLNIGEFYQSSAGISTSGTKRIDIQIIDLKTRIIKGEIDEVDLEKIAIGQMARVKIPAIKNKTINAKLTRVVPFVSTVKDQDRTSQIELEIIDTDTLIPVGASADVEIIVSSKDDAMILPAKLLTGFGNNRSVYVIEDNKLKATKVKIGVGNYNRVEILEGVKETDLIAEPLEGAELSDGMKVKTKETTWLTK